MSKNYSDWYSHQRASSVVIVGTKDTAQLANYYLDHDSSHEVVAFTVNKKYMPLNPEFEGKPIIAFEELEKEYPPSEFKLFAPMTGAGMNKKREAVYLAGKEKGYKYISYVSSKATRFNGKIGENCFILEDNTIQPFVDIGNNVVIWSGCHVGHGTQIKHNVFLTSHVVISGNCLIEPYSWFGVNSTIRDYTTIAEGTLVGMSAAITKNTEKWSTYFGVPAKKVEKSPLEANP